MRLSDVCFSEPTEVPRDGEFQSLGTLTTRGDKILSYIATEEYLEQLLANPDIACVIAHPELANKVPSTLGLAVTAQPSKVFVALQNALVRDTDFYWKDAPSEIMEDTNIHPSAFISSKSVRIGHRVVIGPNASVLERTILGDDVTIRAGCVVGTEGFEFKRIGGEILPVFHDGGVRLGNRVEVQANTCISRGLFGATTEIGDDTKIDNLVHVAHNVRIGKRCLIAANAMLGGSATLGDDVWIGPGAQISSGVRIGDRASVTLGSVVTKDVAPGERVTGNFAIKHEKFIDFIRSIR